jgi:PAS domain S-box-containing protein
MGNVADITDRKRAEAALQESELWMRSIFDAMQDAVIILTPQRTVMDINPAAEKMFGYGREEVIGHTTEILHVDSEHYLEFQGRIKEAFENRSSVECDFQAKRKNREIFPTEHRVSLLKDKSEEPIGIVSVVRDITEKRQAEQKINASLREKEVMLREIHHRVKNNLAVIISLLSLQSEYARTRPGYNAFEELQERIRSMALAHEFLYQSENLADLRIGDYIEGLVSHLVRSMADVGTEVELKREIEQVSFNLDTAIPLGFLLTELISNCLKHAFPKRSRGEIRLSLRSCGEGEFDLIVADNGVGMPEDIDLDHPRSLGLDLVGVFVTQLQGQIEIRRTGGTEVLIRFKEAARRRPIS